MYKKPTLQVVKIQHYGIICVSEVDKTQNNAEIEEEILPGDTPGRSRRNNNVWDDDEELESDDDHYGW